jgi:hypothetical protein
VRQEQLFDALDRYTKVAPQRRKAEMDNFFIKNCTSEASLAELAKNPLISQREQHSMQPNMERKIALNWAWLQEHTGKAINSQTEYELERNKWSKEHGGYPEPSDQDSFNDRRKEYEKLKANDT